MIAFEVTAHEQIVMVIVGGLLALVLVLHELWVELKTRRSNEDLEHYGARRQIENEMLHHQVRMDAKNVRRQIDDELRE
jgi:hypothetical protein